MVFAHGPSLLLPSTRTRCGDLGCRHQISDVFLKEFVIAVQFIVFLLDGIDSVKYLEKGFV